MKGKRDTFVVGKALFLVVLALVDGLFERGPAGFGLIKQRGKAERRHNQSLLLCLKSAQHLLAEVAIA